MSVYCGRSPSRGIVTSRSCIGQDQETLRGGELQERTGGMDDNTFSGLTAHAAVGEPGFFFDFLGTKTRTGYLPENCQWLSGKVFGFPAPNALILYEYEEC